MDNHQQQSPIISKTTEELSRYIGDFVHQSTGTARKIIGISGPPAAGKSTLLRNLVDNLQTEIGSDRVIGIPMDGFHLDNRLLDIDGTRERKGAPYTFDVGGLLSLVNRLGTDETPIYAPEFDRANDLSRNCAVKISANHDVVILEGNYLMLDQPGWCAFVKFFDLTIAIDVPNDILHQRLVQRWLDHGLSTDDAVVRATLNDIPNAETVRKHSRTAHIIYRPEKF